MKNHYCSLFVLLSIAAVTFFSGCNGDRPEGMPKLYPTKITITYDDGTPVTAARVQLFSKSGLDARWAPMGSTDINGLCEPLLLGNWKGVPEGEWTVCVTRVKAIYTEADLESDDNGVHGFGERPIGHLTLVDPIFNKQESSELTLTVVKGGPNEVTLSVGEKLQNYVQLSKRKGRGDLDEEEEE